MCVVVAIVGTLFVVRRVILWLSSVRVARVVALGIQLLRSWLPLAILFVLLEAGWVVVTWRGAVMFGARIFVLRVVLLVIVIFSWPVLISSFSMGVVVFFRFVFG